MKKKKNIIPGLEPGLAGCRALALTTRPDGCCTTVCQLHATYCTRACVYRNQRFT